MFDDVLLRPLVLGMRIFPFAALELKPQNERMIDSSNHYKSLVYLAGAMH